MNWSLEQLWIICSDWPIMRSIWENIRTEVLKYGLNEVRSVLKAEVRIFSCMDRTNWSIRALLYSHNQRRKTKFTEHICVFLECGCWKGNGSSMLASHCGQVHTGFGRSIRLWTDLGLTNQIASLSCYTIKVFYWYLFMGHPVFNLIIQYPSNSLRRSVGSGGGFSNWTIPKTA